MAHIFFWHVYHINRFGGVWWISMQLCSFWPLHVKIKSMKWDTDTKKYHINHETICAKPQNLDTSVQRSPLFHLIETIKMLCFHGAPAVCASMDKDVVTTRKRKKREKKMWAYKKLRCAVSARVSTSIDLMIFRAFVLCPSRCLYSIPLVICWFDQHTRIAIKSINLIHVSHVKSLLTRE